MRAIDSVERIYKGRVTAKLKLWFDSEIISAMQKSETMSKL